MLATSADLSSIALQLVAGLLCGGIVNWLADVLPNWPQGASLMPRISRRWGWVMVACVGIFFYVGGVAGLWITDAPLDHALIFLYLALFLLIATIDLEHRRVLNCVLAPAALASLILAAAQSPLALGGALLSGLGGIMLFLVVNVIRPGAIGAGDVKLAGVIGIIAGFPQVIVALVVGIIAGGVGASILMAGGWISRKGKIAYAPYLSLGAVIALLHGSQILAWYAQRLAG